MLHGRLRELLRLLLAAETPVTSSVIAANVKVTTRTVRNDIKELQTIVEKHGASIQSVRGSGYKLLIRNEQPFKNMSRFCEKCKTGFFYIAVYLYKYLLI